MNNNKIKNYFILFIIVFVFAVPFIAAHFYYYYGDHKNTIANNARLLNNPHNISELNLKDIDLNSAKWRVLYLAPKICDNSCEQLLYKLQQIHIALGKNVNRFVPIILHDSIQSNAAGQKWQAIYTKYSHMRNVHLLNKTTINIIENNKIYLADPLGNIILGYDITKVNFIEQLFFDIKKLINLSNIG